MPKKQKLQGRGEKKSPHFHVAKDLSHWREFRLNSCHCWQLELRIEQGSSRILILPPCWPKALTIQLIIFKGTAQSSRPSACWVHISAFTAFVPADDQDSHRDWDKNSLRKVWEQQHCKALLVLLCRGIQQEIQHMAAPSCGYRRGVQGVGGEHLTPRGEARGAPLPLNISSRFMDIHTHSGKRIKQTELVTVAFAPDWLGYLSNTFTATQHLPLRAIMPTADRSRGSSCGAGFGNCISKTDWAKSAHDKKELGNPATKAVIFVKCCYSFLV